MIRLRKLRKRCWYRPHKWRGAYHWQTGELVEYWCDNCATKKPA